MMNLLVIFDFTKETDLAKWYVVNDTVMGGESSAKMRVDAASHGLFGGHVSLDNNGGFSSVRYDAGKTKLAGYSKFVIVLKGDGIFNTR
ncbi:MAG: CIA30 family protein [Ferruginibacter sp.]